MKKRFAIFVLFLLSGVSQTFAQSGLYDVNTIQEVRISFHESNWDHLLDSLIQVGDGTGRLIADVTVNGQSFPNSGVRYKGFSSWQEDQDKNPFNIELDFPVKNRNYNGYTKLKLGNVIHDPSFVREVLAYRIARKYMPASQANFAKVYVNDVLIGLYTSVEAVDENFNKKFFDSDENAFFKGSPENLQYPFGQNANLAYTHGSDTLDYTPYYKMESEGGWGELLNMIWVLNYDTTSLETILDVDRTLWMHAFNYSIVNLDSYIGYSQNYYLYKDDNGRFNTIPWDLNMSFGSFRNSDGVNLSLTIAKAKSLNPLQHLYSTTLSPRPLTKNIFKNPRWRKMYLAHMRTIINENIRNNEYYNYGQQVQAIIDAAVQQDTNKFYSYSYFTENIDTIVGSGISSYPGLKDLMDARIAYLDTFPGFNFAPEISAIENQPVIPLKEQMIWIRAKIMGANYAQLNYRFRKDAIFSKTEMFDDGNHNDGVAGDSIYGAGVLLDGDIFQYYIWAEDDSAGVFSPERAEYEFHILYPQITQGDLVINEFYNNWIELYNTTSEAMMISGMYLTDDPANPLLWPIPDTIIEGRSYLMVGTSLSQNNSIISSTLSLPEQNGKIILAYDATNMIDSVHYALQTDSKSIGRYPNGYGPFMYLSPTFSQFNVYGNNVAADLIVYPNPATDEVYIELNDVTSSVSLDIFNARGQVVLSELHAFYEYSPVTATIPVNISSFNQGVYYIRVVSNDQTFQKKLVIY